jgi:hypothetical protein
MMNYALAALVALAVVGCSKECPQQDDLIQKRRQFCRTTAAEIDQLSTDLSTPAGVHNPRLAAMSELTRAAWYCLADDRRTWVSGKMEDSLGFPPEPAKPELMHEVANEIRKANDLELLPPPRERRR